jgi:hypothetical protein
MAESGYGTIPPARVVQAGMRKYKVASPASRLRLTCAQPLPRLLAAARTSCSGEGRSGRRKRRGGVMESAYG